MGHYDNLEKRSIDQREAEQFAALRALSPATADIRDLSGLQTLPVFRKSELTQAQAENPPLGGLKAQATHLFQSPGPIYEPGHTKRDWWRLGRFAHAIGIGPDDLVQNTFSHHFTPAGMMFESAALAVGAKIFPAGPGNTQAQVEAAQHLGTTAYAGTPDYLGTILAKADEAGAKLSITKAAVSAGPLFPQVREGYAARDVLCRQCYATADAGLIAYETAESIDGMIVDEGVILEIVTPGTGDAVAPGEIGEVLVTVLNPDYPLIRFATGDMSSILPGQSACGRTNIRMTGWKGRADQATKVRGMFVRPEQLAGFLKQHPQITRARVEVGHDGANDTLTVKLEGAGAPSDYADTLADAIKVRPQIEMVEEGALPRDGVLIADLRTV